MMLGKENYSQILLMYLLKGVTALVYSTTDQLQSYEILEHSHCQQVLAKQYCLKHMEELLTPGQILLRILSYQKKMTLDKLKRRVKFSYVFHQFINGRVTFCQFSTDYPLI